MNETTEPISGDDSQKYFISEDNFQALRNLQHEIYEKTEVSPTIRKLVNMLINKEENIMQLKNELINQFS